MSSDQTSGQPIEVKPDVATCTPNYSTFECLGAPSGLTLTRQEINRLILEYLIVEGYMDAAEKFSREIGFSQPLSEVHPTGASLSERMSIREAVLSRRIEDTISKVNDLWPELFDKNPYIYFQLRQLQMLELIRGRRLEEALTFAQSYLAGPLIHRLADHPQLLHEMENTMALLAFEEPTESIYGCLLGARHAELIAGALNRAILHHIETSGGGGEDEVTQDLSKPRKSRAAGGASAEMRDSQYAFASTVPRLTKLMALLLHFRDLAHIELPSELATL